MRVELFSKLPGLLLSILLVIVFSSTALADTSNRPYFKAYGSDVMAGGWFANGSSCSTDSASNYQYPGFSNSSLSLGPNPNYGGILTYAKQNSGKSAGGSSSQYAAYTMGAIDGDTSAGSTTGFYSAGALAAGSSDKNLLSFANVGSAWGGNFEGTVRQSHCIPDYFSKKPATATPKATTDSLNSYNSTGSYAITAGAGSNYKLTSGDVTIPSGVKLTVFVTGSVYINNNISYQSSTVTAVPKFALVVKGSIYIGPNVTRLDGFYVAQPAVTSASAINTDTGIIWTCHPDDQAPLPYQYPTAPQCANTLVINGALAAKQVNFLRVKGDIASASTGEDTVAGGMASSSIAEIINYTPQMIMGGAFFTTTSNQASGLPIDSLVSLPPVF